MATATKARARARASTATTSALLLLGLAGSAAAQNADAEVLFNEAVALETEGNIPKACEAFVASNRIEPRAGTLIRLGQCREKQQLFVSAWSAYKDALTRVKDPAKKKLAEERIKALEPTLSYLTVSVPDDVRVDGLVVTRNGKPVDPVLWNRAVPVDGGSYTIVGIAPGQEPWHDRTLPATAGAATFRAFTAAGYKGDFSRVPADHALTTLGKHIAPLLTATLSPELARPSGLSARLRAR